MPRVTRKPTFATYRTQTAFAKGLKGTAVTTLAGWLRHPEWQWSRKGPWSQDIVPDVLQWAADTMKKGPKPGAGDSEDVKELRKQKLQQEVRKLSAQAEAAEADNLKIRGLLVEAPAVESEWAGIGVLLRNAFQNLGAQLVPLALTHGMPHEAAGAFQEQAESAVAGILRRLSQGEAGE